MVNARKGGVWRVGKEWNAACALRVVAGVELYKCSHALGDTF